MLEWNVALAPRSSPPQAVQVGHLVFVVRSLGNDSHPGERLPRICDKVYGVGVFDLVLHIVEEDTCIGVSDLGSHMAPMHILDERSKVLTLRLYKSFSGHHLDALVRRTLFPSPPQEEVGKVFLHDCQVGKAAKLPQSLSGAPWYIRTIFAASSSRCK